MTPEQLKEGQLYHYHGDKFRHTTIRYDGPKEGYFGMLYIFEVMYEGWQVGGGYGLSRESLNDITEQETN
jgi:hypothetical protein